MLLAHNFRRQDAARRIQGIHSRVNTLTCNVARKDRRRVQVREGGRRCRVRQVIGRDVNCLHRRDGTLLGGGDALLQSTHVRRQGRLITDGGGHASQQCRNLGTRLGKAENVVDEEKHVLVSLIAKVLRHRESRKTHAHSCARRLIHLSVDQRRFIEDAALLHFAVEVVTLSRALADTGEYRDAAVCRRDIVD